MDSLLASAVSQEVKQKAEDDQDTPVKIHSLVKEPGPLEKQAAVEQAPQLGRIMLAAACLGTPFESTNTEAMLSRAESPIGQTYVQCSSVCSKSAMREGGKGCSWPNVQVAILVDASNTPLLSLLILSHSLRTQGHLCTM
eukprot:1160534-Pelagomonas_calceolata.AAC.28